MVQEIPEYPDIPGPLRTAAAVGSLVPFVGAGVSRLARCPGWADFGDAALKFCVDKGGLTYGDIELLKHLQPRVKLSIFRSLQTDVTSDDYRALLKARELNNKDGQQVYQAIAKLSQQVVTTNYDEWLDRSLPIGTATSASAAQRKVCYGADLTVSNLRQRLLASVFHIHGSVLDPGSMVLTTSDYLRLYRGHRMVAGQPDENPYLNFLTHLFKTRTVLFIGYGLQELEILEYVLSKADSRQSSGMTASREVKHYLIDGFFEHQRPLTERLEQYFKDFGIGLLPYSRDKGDHRHLINVIERLAVEIPAQPRLTLEDDAAMEALLQ